MMQRSDEKTLAYGEEVGNESLKQKYKRIARTERRGFNFVRNFIRTTTDDTARAACVNLRRSSVASFASGLVEPFREKTIKTFIALVYHVATKCCVNFPDIEL